ncbi:MAG: PEP-CTERM sorting domain-containing protein [Verrucomicrobiae bacterium]
MKSNSFLLLAVSAAVALSFSSAQAQYTPNFNTYNATLTLSGQDSWDTNDLGQPDAVGKVGGYSQNPLPDNWATLGGLAVYTGYEPDVITTDLWRPFTLPDPNNSNFVVKFAITSSATPNLALDSFGWTFRTNSGVSGVAGDAIAGVKFNPVNVLGEDIFRIYWTDYTGAETATNWYMNYNNKYILNATVTGLDGATPRFVVTYDDPADIKPPDTVIDTPLNTLTPTGVAEVAASWTLTDTTGGSPYQNYGLNAMVFQNYAATVPEPGTWVLFGIGAGVVAMIRRRKTSKA